MALGDVAGDHESCFSDSSEVPTVLSTYRGKVIDHRVAVSFKEGNAQARRHESEGRGDYSRCW